jgi:hypothetical protein
MQRLEALSFVLLMLLSCTASAQDRWFPEPLSPRIASYSISVVLDDEKKTLAGHENLSWRNTSGDQIRELQFHLYLNGFKNSETTFLKDSRSHRGIRMADGGWGWIDVTSITTADGQDLTRNITFIRPDDGNNNDRSVMRVSLSRPVLPGQTIKLKIDFNAKLPRIFARTGFYKDYFMMGQWFPKIGVYESTGQRYAIAGGWNCHQFHESTEFYADFGTYDVQITVPTKYVVGATGTLSSQKENGNGTKTLSFHAEDVHDFAWTAFPGYADLSETWKHVRIRVLIQPQRLHQAPRYFQSVKAALDYFEEHVGPYPYPTLTIVDPAYGASGAAGMEYPTLITAGSLWGIDESLRLAEQVTIHEFGHQYWYGMSASNEFEEAWLDEGVTQYYETRIMDATYGMKNSFVNLLGFQVGDFEYTRIGYTSMHNPGIAPTATPGWMFPQGSYGTLTYDKTAVCLATLEHLVGTPTMDSVMRTFFRRWRFRHPSGRDFVRAFNEVVPALHGTRFGTSLDWYFDQVLYGAGICDYELTSIKTWKDAPPTGVFDSAGTREVDPDSDGGRDDDVYESRITVGRLGDVRLPVTVLVTFEDGETVREAWDGKASSITFRYHRPAAALSATVDPEGHLALDIDGTNNSKTRKPNQAPLWKYTVKMLFWVQNILQIFSMIG